MEKFAIKLDICLKIEGPNLFFEKFVFDKHYKLVSKSQITEEATIRIVLGTEISVTWDKEDNLLTICCVEIDNSVLKLVNTMINSLIIKELEHRKIYMLHASCVYSKQKNRLIILFGDSGAGKTTVMLDLIKKYDLEYVSNGSTLVEFTPSEIKILGSYKNGELVGDIVQGGVGSVVAGDVPGTEEIFVSTENENIENKVKYYTTIFAFGTVIIGLIVYTIFKIFTAFPKTKYLTDEQRNRIFKILMKYDEGKKELFSAYRLNGVGTGYYRVRSMIVDNQKVYIYAKIFSFLYIPTPITLGYLLCYNKDQILASYSNAAFKEAKKKIQETVLYL